MSENGISMKNNSIGFITWHFKAVKHLMNEVIFLGMART